MLTKKQLCEKIVEDFLKENTIEPLDVFLKDEENFVIENKGIILSALFYLNIFKEENARRVAFTSQEILFQGNRCYLSFNDLLNLLPEEIKYVSHKELKQGDIFRVSGSIGTFEFIKTIICDKGYAKGIELVTAKEIRTGEYFEFVPQDEKTPKYFYLI